MIARLSAGLAVLCLLSAPAFAQGAAKPTDPQIAHIAYTAGQLDIEAANQRGQLVLKKAGTSDYFCKFHPNMKGRVVVVP